MKLSKLLSPNDAKPLEPNISNVAPKDSKMMKRIILIGNLSIQVLFLEIALVYYYIKFFSSGISFFHFLNSCAFSKSFIKS